MTFSKKLFFSIIAYGIFLNVNYFNNFIIYVIYVL
jgi:hypothetical protein